MARAQSFTDAQKAEIGRILHEYLVQNPEVLREAITELNKREKAEEGAARERLSKR